MKQEAQPAEISYFFGQGYADVGNTIKEAFATNLLTGKNFLENAKFNGVSLKGGMWLCAALSVLVFGTAISLAISAVHVCILALLFLVVYVLFSLVWLVDRVYIMIHKISTACPNPDCQEKFMLPVYRCSCGRVHTRLIPGKYGILHRKCDCGAKLPTTFLNGRERLEAFCPKCGSPLDSAVAMQIAIPIIGGPSVGKTCYINMAVNELIENIGPSRGWEMSFTTEKDKQEYERSMNALKQGVRPEKTDFDKLTAYKLLVKLPGNNIMRRIYVYDIAGEMFSSSGDIQQNKAYEYSDGFVFMIDPLSIGRYAMEKADLDLESYGMSTKDFDDILGIMLVNLEKLFGLKPSDALKKNLAVVINKCDIPGLEAQIGDAAAEKYMQEHPDCKSFEEAKNTVCKDFLIKYDAGNFVRTADKKFKQVQYFTCSALGHNTEGVQYKAVGVDKPLMWILENIDSGFKK